MDRISKAKQELALLQARIADNEARLALDRARVNELQTYLRVDESLLSDSLTLSDSVQVEVTRRAIPKRDTKAKEHIGNAVERTS